MAVKQPMAFTLDAQLYLNNVEMTFFGEGALTAPAIKPMLTSAQQELFHLRDATAKIKAQLKWLSSGAAEARVDALVDVNPDLGGDFKFGRFQRAGKIIKQARS